MLLNQLASVYLKHDIFIYTTFSVVYERPCCSKLPSPLTHPHYWALLYKHHSPCFLFPITTASIGELVIANTGGDEEVSSWSSWWLIASFVACWCLQIHDSGALPYIEFNPNGDDERVTYKNNTFVVNVIAWFSESWLIQVILFDSVNCTIITNYIQQ